MASITDTSKLSLVAFVAADNGKSLFAQSSRDVLATAPSGSFVDVTDDLGTDRDAFLAMASASKLTSDQRKLKQRYNSALSRAVKRDNDKRTISGFRFVAETDDNGKPTGNVAGYGIIIG